MAFNNTMLEFCLPENPLPKRLQEYRLKRLFTDVTIKVGDEQFPAHRIVLEDSSPVLKALLSDNWTQNNVCEFNQQFVDSDIVEHLLNFFYTAKIIISTENVHSICIASHFLNIPSLLNICEEFLRERVSTGNVLDLFLLSDKLKLVTLQQSCIACVMENFDIVQNDIKLLGYSLEDLQTIIRLVNEQKGDAKVKEFLFALIINWIENDINGRQASLPVLLRSVPLHELSLQFLSEVVATQNIITESPPCGKLLNDAFSKSYLNSPHSSRRPNSSTANQLYCFGGQNENGEFLSSVSCLNLTSRQWTRSTSMPTTKGYYFGAVISNKIYICGGWVGNRKLNTLEVYDCDTKIWNPLRSMPHPRSSSAAVSWNEFVYVSGGYDGANNMLSSVHRYSVAIDEWQTIKSMHTPRYGHQLVELGGRLYAIGGMDRNSAEVYDPATDEWRMIANTRHKHCWSGAASHHGKIYICSYNGFEVYTPDTNTWNTLAPLNNHYGQTLVSVNGKLWAVGGGNAEKGTKSVFEFDTLSQRWTPLPDMDVARIYHCSFIVNTL